MNIVSLLLAINVLALPLAAPLCGGELPPELPLWADGQPAHPVQLEVEEQMRSVPARKGSLSGLNRVFSCVSLPTYSIHRPEKPNGVGLVICPGGGFRDVWLDREGHDFAIWLKNCNVTCLVLKYRTRAAYNINSPGGWQSYQRAVLSDGRQAIRVLRNQAGILGLEPNKIGISGFSAGGYLAINCALQAEPALAAGTVSGMPDFAGLIYPGIPEDTGALLERRSATNSTAPAICPIFMVNARIDKLTPVDKCIEFYASLLRAGVEAELHVFGKGSHGFGMGEAGGQSLQLWPTSFAAWLRDGNFMKN